MRTTTTLPTGALLALVALVALAAPAALADAGVDASAGVSVDATAPAPSLPDEDAAPVEVLDASDAAAPSAASVADALPVEPPVDLSEAPLAERHGLRTPSVLADAGIGAQAEAEVDSPLEPAGQRVAADGWDEPLTTGALDRVQAAAPAAVAGAGALALLQAFGGFRWLGALGFALYSRLTKSDLLDNEHRDRVYKLVQENPGLGLTEISERSGLGWGTTVYHMDRLERAGFVASERAGLHRCYFPVGTVAKESRKAIGALKADTTRSIAEFLVTRPGATQSELCQALGMSASAASKQVTKLAEAGLVRRERDWKTVHLYPEAPLRDMLGGPAEAPSPAGPAAAPTPLAA